MHNLRPAGRMRPATGFCAAPRRIRMSPISAAPQGTVNIILNSGVLVMSATDISISIQHHAESACSSSWPVSRQQVKFVLLFRQSTNVTSTAIIAIVKHCWRTLLNVLMPSRSTRIYSTSSVIRSQVMLSPFLITVSWRSLIFSVHLNWRHHFSRTTF